MRAGRSWLTPDEMPSGLATSSRPTPPPSEAAAVQGTRGRSLTLVVLAGWAGLLAVAVVVGQLFEVRIGAPPFYGRWALPGWTWRLLPAAGIGVLAVSAGLAVSARVRWRTLLLLAAGLAAAWGASLELIDGPSDLTARLSSRHEFLHYLPRVDSVSDWLRGFVDNLPLREANHVKTHPPGMVLALVGLDRLGLQGTGWAAALCVAGGVLMVPASLVALKETTGEAAARRAAPFVALAPAVLFVATSTDALFGGVAASGAALLVLATGRSGPRSDGLAVGGGLLLGAALFLSYGMVLLLSIPLAVAAARRRLRPLVVAALGAASVAAAFGAAGFWWWEGFLASRERHLAGITSVRPYGYFVIGNLAVFAALVGPATAVAVARLRDRQTWLLVGAALASVVLADVSGMSQGEVERLWLPFAPWVVLACHTLARRPRAWLAAHAATAFGLQVVLRSPW